MGSLQNLYNIAVIHSGVSKVVHPNMAQLQLARCMETTRDRYAMLLASLNSEEIDSGYWHIKPDKEMCTSYTTSYDTVMCQT